MSSALDAEVFVLGSAGVKAMAVVRGEADVYVFSGWLYEWDVCAPAAVAAAAGLHVSLLDGSPFTYNKANPGSHGIVVCRPELAGTVLDAYRSRSRRGSAW